MLLDICAYSWSIYLDLWDDSWVLNVSKYGLHCQSSGVRWFSYLGTCWDLKCSWVTWALKKKPVCNFSFLMKLFAESNAVLGIILSRVFDKLVQVAVFLTQFCQRNKNLTNIPIYGFFSRSFFSEALLDLLHKINLSKLLVIISDATERC